MFKWIGVMFSAQYALRCRIAQLKERQHQLDMHEDSIESERLFIELQLPRLEHRLKLANPKLTPADRAAIEQEGCHQSWAASADFRNYPASAIVPRPPGGTPSMEETLARFDTFAPRRNDSVLQEGV